MPDALTQRVASLPDSLDEQQRWPSAPPDGAGKVFRGRSRSALKKGASQQPAALYETLYENAPDISIPNGSPSVLELARRSLTSPAPTVDSLLAGAGASPPSGSPHDVPRTGSSDAEQGRQPCWGCGAPMWLLGDAPTKWCACCSESQYPVCARFCSDMCMRDNWQRHKESRARP
jgi:hypothetical protein